MISLSISGVCNGCENIDLQLAEREFFLGDKMIKQYELMCRHSSVCGKLLEENKKNLMRAKEIEKTE